MNLQTIDVETPANGRANTDDKLMESALDFLSDEKPANDNVPQPKPKKPVEEPREQPAPKPRPEPEGEGDEGDDPEDVDDSEPAEEGEGDGHAGRGSKEDPFTVKDLPKDRYIELKIDGEKAVVPLDELAAGYIREKTFSQRINRTKSLADEAQRMVTEAVEFPKRLREEFRTFVSDADQLFDFFTVSDEREAILDQVARRYAEQVRHFREHPNDRLMYQRKRDQERLAREREAFEEQKRTEQRAREQKEAQERALAIFKPGWETGIRRAGFPKATPELYNEVMLRANQKAAQGGQVTSDDIAEWVVRAAKLLELPKAGEKKPAPAPVAPPREKPRTKGNDWAKVPRRDRRGNVDYFLQGLRGRDFR